MESPKELIITCADGFELRLVELELNEQFLLDLMSYHERIPTHLVRLPERIVEQERVSPSGLLMYLPRCGAPGCSTIVGFQETWAPPVDAVVSAELETLDCQALAFDEVGSW